MAPTLATAVDNGTVLILIMVAVVPIAAFSFARSGAAWRGIGKGRFAIEQELPPSPSRAPEPEVDRRVQAAEARQMLEAKSYRRTRAGQAPLDVEAEVARLLDLPPRQEQADEALRAEVRQLVVARNERRMRRGEEPLDVEAETERQLADLIGSG
ncbi:MAG TPA: hypothetical protein VF176_09240 [Solirubrobacterales bacterium]